MATHRPSTLVVSPAPMDHPSPDRRIAHRGRNEDDVQSIERYSWGWPLAPVLTSPTAITVASRMSYWLHPCEQRRIDAEANGQKERGPWWGMTGTRSEGGEWWEGGREDGCGGGRRGGVWDGTLYQADRLEITRQKGDAASGSGEYAFWITGGCPWEGCLVVCRARLASLRSSLANASCDFGERDTFDTSLGVTIKVLSD